VWRARHGDRAAGRRDLDVRLVHDHARRKLPSATGSKSTRARCDVLDIQLLRTTLVEFEHWLGVDQPTERVHWPNNSS